MNKLVQGRLCEFNRFLKLLRRYYLVIKRKLVFISKCYICSFKLNPELIFAKRLFAFFAFNVLQENAYEWQCEKL